jgi:hypothetical protein
MSATAMPYLANYSSTWTRTAATRGTQMIFADSPAELKDTVADPSITPGGLVNSARAAPSYRIFVSSHLFVMVTRVDGSKDIPGSSKVTTSL